MKAPFVSHPIHVAVAIALSAASMHALPACDSTGNNTCTSTLANTPLPVVSSVAPNILFMIDSSGSMSNIVPPSPTDTPAYDPSSTYLATCPAANLQPGGSLTVSGANASSFDIRVTSAGVVTFGGNTFGTGSGQRCFDNALYYGARLNGNDGSGRPGGGYLDAVYTGHFLNWYFGNPSTSYTTAATFNGSSGPDYGRKPGTKSRLQISQDASKLIINSLDKVRIGLARYNSASSGSGGELVEPVADLTTSFKGTLGTRIDALSPSGNTPLAETLSGIGHYFSTGATNVTLRKGQSGEASTARSTVFSGDGASLRNGTSVANPITAWCQRSFAVLLTDGRPQGDRSISSTLCDYQGIMGGCSTYGFFKPGPDTTGPNAGYHVRTSGSTTYRQLHEGGAHEYESEGSDYLDDVAAALFEADLRPDLTKPTGSNARNNLFTYTIGFADEQAKNDPLLREAATSGGGLFKSAANSTELVKAFQDATDDILAKDGGAAAVAVANAQVTNTDNASYATSYNSGTWTGDLIAYPINTNTGIPEVNNPVWNTGCANPTALVDPADASKGVLGCSAQVQLNAKSPSTRVVFTSNDTSSCHSNCGIPFQPFSAAGTAGTDKLSSVQRDRLRTPTGTSTFNADGDAVVNYTRGDRSGETAGTYRTRAHIFGDTINAEPVVIGEPKYNYADLGYSVDYCTDGTTTCTTKSTAFKTANENRPRIIVQPANDGMVHAFNSLTGAEEWAYIPGPLITDFSDPGNGNVSILNTRTRKQAFEHYYLLDATPVSGDVDFNRAGSATSLTSPEVPAWKSIVVSGYGKGGRGYFALDVTTTTGITETAANAQTKVLWEFPRSVSDTALADTNKTSTSNRSNFNANVGYSFGKPIITKTAAAGWVVLVTSGYNNGSDSGQPSSGAGGSTPTVDGGGDGYGHLYVLNAKTGDLIKDIRTPQCNTAVAATAANSQIYPCGLTHINGYVEDRDVDNTTTYVYAGDLYGNVWRFDLTGTSTSSWSVAKLAVLREGPAATDRVQPVTSAPELGRVPTTAGDKYFVYIGTGQYLDKNDLPCPTSGCTWTPAYNVTQKQSMYGLIDPRVSSPNTADYLRGKLQTQTFTTSGSTRTATNTALTLTGGSAQNGWVVDFTGGERIVTDPTLAAGSLVFTSNQPSSAACTPGGSSWLYALDYLNGGMTTAWAGTSLGSVLVSRPVLVQLPNGKIFALTRTSDGRTISTEVPISVTADAGKRVSWRELFDR